MGGFILIIFLFYVLIMPLIIRYIINLFNKDASDKALFGFLGIVLFMLTLWGFISMILSWGIVTLNL